MFQRNVQYKTMQHGRTLLVDIIKREIQRHRETYQPDVVRDLIDLCIEKQLNPGADSDLFTGTSTSGNCCTNYIG